MQLGFGLRLRHEVRLETQLRLTLRQRLKLESRLELVSFDLVQAINDIHYQAKGQCLHCHYPMTLHDILAGFSSDPIDRSTKCPRCKKMMNAELVSERLGTSSSVAFFCGSQVLWALRTKHGLVKLNLQEFESNNAGVFHSALVHFGSLKNAYAKIGIEYPYESTQEDLLKIKIIPFLGQMPDSHISRLTGVKYHKIRKWRLDANIDKYSKSKLLERMGEL